MYNVSIDKQPERKFPVVFSLAILLIGYFLSAFLKLSASITMPYFQQKLGLTSSIVGLISSMFFVTYAITQVAGGALCVRVGSLVVMGIGFFLSAIGSLLFSFASSPLYIVAGRILMGLGIGPAFVSVIAFLQENYSGSRYAKLTGFSVMVCNMGSACSSAPMNYLVNKFGISALFIFLTLLQMVLSVLAFVFSKIYKNHKSETDGTNMFGQIVFVSKMLISDKKLTGALIVWTAYNAFLSVYHGLWCVKWTSVCFETYKSAAAYCGTVLGIGTMIGCLTSEYCRNKAHSRETTVRIHAVIDIILFGLLILVKNIKSSELFLVASISVDAIYGASVGMLCVQISALVRETSDSKHNAVIMGIFNGIANFICVALQSSSGVLIDSFGKTFSVKAAFLISFAVFEVAFIFAVVCGNRLIRSE